MLAKALLTGTLVVEMVLTGTLVAEVELTGTWAAEVKLTKTALQRLDQPLLPFPLQHHLSRD